MKILDLACGGTKTPGTVGIDQLELPGVDIVHNLNQTPYPFEDDTFDKVVCINGMEHFEKPLDVMAELHRICKRGGVIYIATPHFSSVDFYTDPTHLHPFSSRSFDFLVPGTQLFNLQYSKARFRKITTKITFFDLPRIINRCLSWFANKHTTYYERHFAFIFPAHQIIFELEVVK